LINQTRQPIEQVRFNDLFNRLTKIEPGMDEQQIKAAKRYRVLEKVFKATFTDLTVYRVGMIQVQVYITGVNTCGLSGLQTLSIET
jgi:Nuclease A inhibitor-like protein